MRNLNKYFESKAIDYEKLCDYGFSKKGNRYCYESSICDDHFKVVVELSKEIQTSKVIDLELNEEYVLVDVEKASGDFVGKVKEEYEILLKQIVKKCSTPDVFKSKQAEYVIKYIKEKYNDSLEFLWEKFPNDAVWRNKNNNKWYGVLMVLSEGKLGIDSNKIIDIIDLRYQKEKINEIIDNKKIFSGYHMNKNNWITIKLDESVDIKDIYKLIDNSYKLSIEK